MPYTPKGAGTPAQCAGGSAGSDDCVTTRGAGGSAVSDRATTGGPGSCGACARVRGPTSTASAVGSLQPRSTAVPLALVGSAAQPRTTTLPPTRLPAAGASTTTRTSPSAAAAVVVPW